MLDRKQIVENAAQVKQNCLNRGVTVDVQRMVELELQRREKDRQAQEYNRQANENNQGMKAAKTQEQRQPIIAKGKELRALREAAQAEHDQLERQVAEIQSMIPNLSHPAAPIGEDDKSNLEVKKGKTTIPQFSFAPQDHVEIGDRLDLIDFEAGARTTGAGFYFLKNEAVLIELALQQFAVNFLVDEGFTPTITPDLAQDSILEGIGFIPRGPETQIYSIEQTDLSLIGTAEITLGGLYSGQTLDEEQLPLKLCGISHCYRTEAGAAGRASRGLYRVHQFTKIEMFAFTTPDQSDAMHDYLCDLECRIFDSLGLPYRVVDTATGDLGGPAYRKFDLEAWMPGRGDGGEYGEVTSTSNCTDYQSRRLNIRCKKKGEKGTRFVHTLNGTAVAISRALLAILENYQQADGSVAVPEVLQRWVGKDRIFR